jgi:hypothetical protein
MGFYDFNARTLFNLRPYTFFSDNNFGIHRHSEMAQYDALQRQMLDSDAGPSGSGVNL